MEFLKKHYEKILLSVVLLCLAITAAWLPIAINHAHEELQKSILSLPKPKEAKPVDLTTNQMALARLQNPPTIVLAGEHNLFNPVTWKFKSDATGTNAGRITLLKIVKEGVDALVVTKITPLYLELNLDRVAAAGYWVGVKRLSAKKPPTYAKLNEKKDLFTIKEVKGPPEDPTELVLELTENAEIVSISKEKPYRKIEGYEADLRYEPDNLTFLKKRVNDTITFGGESYKIIAITENAVRVQAISTDKRSTISLKGAP